MLQKTIILSTLLILVIALASCGSRGGSAANTVEETKLSSTGVRLNEDYADALPVASQLSIGTLALKDTENAVTVEQAKELLTAWKMLQALQSSGTAAQAELDAAANQIQKTMTDEQLAAIKAMQLTPDNMMQVVQELGFSRGGGGTMAADRDGGRAGFTPPAGIAPAGGGGGFGGGFGGGGFGTGGGAPLEEGTADQAQRTNAIANTMMARTLITLLEARAEGQDWAPASQNQGFAIQRTLLDAVAEATGLNQQEILAQTSTGQTLSEVCAAHNTDADEVVAQVVASETERINQAVNDGGIEQTEADTYLAELETRVRTLMEEPLQINVRGAPGAAPPPSE